MQKSLIVSINGREALPVRAIPYVAGRSFLSPDEIAKHLARQIGAPFARLQNTTAFHLSGKKAIPVSPKEWDETAAQFDALESKLKREQPTDDEGYAVWLEQSTERLPPGVFVWREEFENDFRRDIKNIAPEVRREGDDTLNYSPMLSDSQRKMISALKPPPPARIFSSAPPPIKPLSGTHYRAPKQISQSPDWSEWIHIPEVGLPHACALSLNINPHSLIYDRFDCEWEPDTNDASIKQEFAKRLRILTANQYGPHFSACATGYVNLLRFSSWAMSVVNWEGLPAELEAMTNTNETEPPLTARTSLDDDIAVAEKQVFDGQHAEAKKSGRYPFHIAAKLIAQAAGQGVSAIKLRKRLEQDARKKVLPAYVIGQTIGWDRDMPFLSALEIHWDDLNAWLDTNEPRISWQFPAPAQAGAPAAPSDTKRKDLSTDDDEIGTRASGEPDLVKGKNGRKRVEAWVEWQAKESVKVGDTTDALAERIRLTADKWGYESERGKLTVASIIKMLPAGITGGRRGRPKK